MGFSDTGSDGTAKVMVSAAPEELLEFDAASLVFEQADNETIVAAASAIVVTD